MKISGREDWAKKYDLREGLIDDYLKIFESIGIPVVQTDQEKSLNRIVMVSTHGYWENPPPTGLPDTGGQTYYVLEVSKAWAGQGKQVLILSRWFEPYPRVERFAENVWLIRIRAGGDAFVRKEDIYPLVPELAEAAVAISLLFGAGGVVGHYADGMVGALEVSERLDIPLIVIPHSMGIRKVEMLGFDTRDPDVWFDNTYHFWTREECELSALRGCHLEIANTPREPDKLKHYYNETFPHVIMQAGAGREFFDVYHARPEAPFLSDYGLLSKRYIIFFGRISESKNAPQTVAVLGELRKRDPKAFAEIKLVIAGGSRHHLLPEEQQEEDRIHGMMGRYHLTPDDVIRIYGHLDRPVLTAMVYHSLCYLGMQVMEPFGMGVAEAMAAGVPAVISSAAGITKWLKNGTDAIVVDSGNPAQAAGEIARLYMDPEYAESVASAGHQVAEEKFSWSGIARKQGELFSGIMEQRHNTGNLYQRHRGYHRNMTIWKNGRIEVSIRHKTLAREWLQPVLSSLTGISDEMRLIVAIERDDAGGSIGAVEYLRYLLRAHGVWASIIDDSAMDTEAVRNVAERIRPISISSVIVHSRTALIEDRIYENVPVHLDQRKVVLLHVREPIKVGADIVFGTS